MAQPPTTAELFKEINDPDYQRAISDGLSAAYRGAFQSARPFRIGIDRMIIFSDLHKGARNYADDFRRCERAYNAALGYYYALGYWLVELGDVEELWEERARSVIAKYERTLRLSAKFHIDPERRGSHYTRLWGNHDDHWNRRDQVKKFLEPIYCPAEISGLQVHGAARIPLVDEAGERVAELFLAHGHQGSFDSDRASWLSRLIVRYVWRPWQRLTKRSLNTPAKDWVLREKHNLAMYSWAASHNRSDFIFVAGHTHRPVFLAESKADRLAKEIRAAETELSTDLTNARLRSEIAALYAELEWTRAEGVAETGKDGLVSPPRACYFNTGCAAYRDGDITGIELSYDGISLVRWPDDHGAPQPKVLASLSYVQLFAAVPHAE